RGGWWRGSGGEGVEARGGEDQIDPVMGSIFGLGRKARRKNAKNPVYSVWMMEDGVLKSFPKLFTINTLGASIKTILEFRKNGDIIVETPIKDYEAAFEVYEPCSELINGLGIRGEVGSFNVSSYMETLLLLDHSDCSMYS
ncbi:hypothetical protein Tco_0105758, partial [Tanacetum coccineum]